MNIRPGTSESTKIPGFDYVRGRHQKFRALCESDREQRRWEEAMESAAQALELAAARCRVAKLMTHGGHVEKGMLARAGLSPDMDPDQVLGLCMRGVAPEMVDAAIARPKK